MNFININENEKINLTPEYIGKAKQILLHEPNLPFSINENSIIFDPYIIGSLKIDKVRPADIEKLFKHKTSLSLSSQRHLGSAFESQLEDESDRQSAGGCGYGNSRHPQQSLSFRAAGLCTGCRPYRRIHLRAVLRRTESCHEAVQTAHREAGAGIIPAAVEKSTAVFDYVNLKC